MAQILKFIGREATSPAKTRNGMSLDRLLSGASVEVTPISASKVADFRALFAPDARLYIAHIDGTDFDDMRATAARLVGEGFDVMPHIPARSVPDAATLDRWLGGYAACGITSALVLAGGRDTPRGAFDSSMALLETGLFDRHGFTRLHVAGHPEGNKDIAGGEAAIRSALGWKRDFLNRTGAEGAIVTQFCFEAEPVLNWARSLRDGGFGLPIHLGVAGPAKLQTLIKYAAMCGVGPSMRVLKRRAADITRLMLPFSPEPFLTEIAEGLAREPDLPIERIHFFPLGGLGKTGEFLGGAGSTERAAQA